MIPVFRIELPEIKNEPGMVLRMAGHEPGGKDHVKALPSDRINVL